MVPDGTGRRWQGARPHPRVTFGLFNKEKDNVAWNDFDGSLGVDASGNHPCLAA
jgi:hypothetical protein